MIKAKTHDILYCDFIVNNQMFRVPKINELAVDQMIRLYIRSERPWVSIDGSSRHVAETFNVSSLYKYIYRRMYLLFTYLEATLL